MFSFVESLRAAGTDITLRHVSVTTDLVVLKDLFSREFSARTYRSSMSIEDLRQIYTGITLSSNADAYMAWAGDLCMFLFEVHEARYYDVPAGLPVDEGDWIVDLFIERHPLMENAMYIAALQACILQCVRQPGVRQLILETHFVVQYKWMKELFTAVGFQFWKEGSLGAGKEIYQLSTLAQ